MAVPARTITLALDISQAFDTISIHILIRMLLQTNIPRTIMKLIANYIKGRKAYIIYRNHTSIQRQSKTVVPQDGYLSPILFNIYTAYLTPPRAPVQVMYYADDITITSTHTQARVQPRNTSNHTYIKFLPGQNIISHTKSGQNNLHSVHSRPCGIYEQYEPQK